MTESNPEQSDRRIAILGVPVEVGASRRGTLMGPAALRTAGLVEALQGLGWQVEDLGDLHEHDLAWSDAPGPANARDFREVGAWTRTLSARAHAMAASGATPVFLGGDHTLSMGSVNGVARHWRAEGRELFVLWLDAHADFNMPATSPSGNMHGMSAAFIAGEPGLDDLLGAEPRCPVPPDRMELIGIRSIDAMERLALRARGIRIGDMRRIDELGVSVLVREFLDRVRAADGVVHVSFDLDFLDPDIAPGAGTVVPGGATYREAHLAMEMLHDSGLVRSADIVELNPYLDDRGRTARVAVELAASLFGQRIAA